jgi:iron-sulfur cluster assembly protein
MNIMTHETSTQQPQTEEKVTLTEKAAQQVQRLMAENNIPSDHGLRLGVKGGGCSGLTYVLGFDAQPKESDTTFHAHGVTIYVDPKSLFFLSGTELDFQDGLNGKGFVFNNPNATKSCGCGHSFSA